MTQNNEQGQGQVTLSLGKRLRQLTDLAKTTVELEAFVKILEEAANRGEDHVVFDDLREYLPNMINAGRAYEWIQANDLMVSGNIDPQTAKHVMTISW